MSSDQKTTRHLMAGFVGGLASSVSLQPLDLIKTRVQQSKNNSITSVLKNLTSIKQLWRGTIPSAFRTSIGSSLYLSSLHIIRTNVANLRDIKGPIITSTSSKLPKLSATQNLLTGMFSRATVGFITMPITIIKVRFESNLYNYTSMFNATTQIFHNEGLKGFFRGFGATCFRDAPYAGIYVSFYEQFKVSLPKLFKIKLNPGEELKTSSSALINSSSAVLAAFFSTAITGPFDTIKTNMQLNPDKYTSFYKTSKLLFNEDWKRLFDGLSLRLIRKAGSAGIAWCIYEELVKL